jgi:flavin-binding protein dodecin
MSVAKFVELSGQSPDSYEAAIREVVERASSTLRNIQSIWVKEFEAEVENNQVSQFRVLVKVSFVLDEGGSAG